MPNYNVQRMIQNQIYYY